MIVAIDGPAGSGKSTTARRVAEQLGYLYLNTGAMYRAVALAFLRADATATEEAAADVLATLALDVQFANGEMHISLGDEDVTPALGRPDVTQMASRVATLAVVREKLVAEQRRLGRRYRTEPGVVLEGRDIGTYVFPEADLKVFMIADLDVRARRRHAELVARGTLRSLHQVRAEMQARDRQDSQRALAPLRKAADAVELDTTHHTIDAQVQFVVEQVRERRLGSSV